MKGMKDKECRESRGLWTRRRRMGSDDEGEED